MARKSKQKPIHVYFSIRNTEYVVMEDETTGKVGLYLVNPNAGSLHINIMHIGIFDSVEFAKNFVNNVHGITEK
ncbi:MAG: hypothetical protein GY793_03350 [Proteobacteria bacterium]|nr:hypothetical protein [Pseudomonadota bacterium]